MSATLRQRCADTLGAGSRCKGTNFFSYSKKIAEKAIFSLSLFYPLLFLELFAG